MSNRQGTHGRFLGERTEGQAFPARPEGLEGMRGSILLSLPPEKGDERWGPPPSATCLHLAILTGHTSPLPDEDHALHTALW